MALLYSYHTAQIVLQKIYWYILSVKFQDQITWGRLILGSRQFTWGRLSLGSELGMNEFGFRTKSLGVDLF